jgi:hypothetical protein
MSCQKDYKLPKIKPECKTVKPLIKKVKFFDNGEVYDEFDNYLGQGVYENGVLTITKQIK